MTPPRRQEVQYNNECTFDTLQMGVVMYLFHQLLHISAHVLRRFLLLIIVNKNINIHVPLHFLSWRILEDPGLLEFDTYVTGSWRFEQTYCLNPQSDSCKTHTTCSWIFQYICSYLYPFTGPSVKSRLPKVRFPFRSSRYSLTQILSTEAQEWPQWGEKMLPKMKKIISYLVQVMRLKWHWTPSFKDLCNLQQK